MGVENEVSPFSVTAFRPLPDAEEVRDLWSHADLAPASGEISAEVPAHGARLFRVGPAR